MAFKVFVPRDGISAVGALGVICGAAILAVVAYINNNISRVGTPYDLNGDVCGEDIIGREFLYYPDPKQMQYPICVEKCPTLSMNGSAPLPDGSGGIKQLPFYDTELCLGHFCLHRGLTCETVTSLPLLSSNFTLFILDDVLKSAEFVVFIIFLTLGLMYLTLSFLNQRRINGLSSEFLTRTSEILSMLLAVLIVHKSYATRSFALLAISLTVALGAGTVSLRRLLPVTFVRSKYFIHLGVQALVEMPDLLLLLFGVCLSAAVIFCLAVLTIIQFFSVGEFVPIPLANEKAIGISSLFIGSFQSHVTKWMSVGIFVAATWITLEMLTAFMQIVTTKAVKHWFESSPVFENMSDCNILNQALNNIHQSLPCLIIAAVCSPFRFPSSIIQCLSSEKVASQDTNRLSVRLFDYLAPLHNARLLHNKGCFLKMTEERQSFFQCAEGGYAEITSGMLPDYQAGKRYKFEEMYTPISITAVFHSLLSIMAFISWTIINMLPVFSTGIKALYSPATSFLIATGAAFVMVIVFCEILETASFAVLYFWFKSSNNMEWGVCKFEYQSQALTTFIEYIQRTSISS